MTDKSILVFFVSGLVLFFICFWIYLQVDEKRCKRANLLRNAEQQHQAILRGNYLRGSYGQYDVPHEFCYLTEPDWTPESSDWKADDE